MIFILEDNDERIECFRRALGDLEHHIERTVPESVDWLSSYKEDISLYSLDNDLYVPDYEKEEGEGWQLCEWILDNSKKAPIICHSTNSDAAVKMEMACSGAGWEFLRIVPFNSFEWIEDWWIDVVREKFIAGGTDPL